jgi:hypothetical protein
MYRIEDARGRFNCVICPYRLEHRATDAAGVQLSFVRSDTDIAKKASVLAGQVGNGKFHID